MSHMVIYRGSDGKPGYHQADELSSAIKYVEHLRNDEGVERARIFRLEEVSFEFRPYYKVEIGLGAMAPGAEPDALPPPPAVEWTASTRPAEGEATASDAPAADVPAWSDMPAAHDADGSDEDSAGHDGMTAGVGNRRGLFGR